MDDLQQRVQTAQTAIQSPDLLDWQKIESGLNAFSGLEVDDLPAHVWAILEREFCVVNAIFDQYDIESHEDYQKMDSEDIQEVLAIIAKVVALLRQL